MPIAFRWHLQRCTLLAGYALATLTSPLCGFANEATARKGAAAYAWEIAQAQVELKEGRVADARKRLEATDESLRGFEFDYLLARAEQAAAEGAAPDLISRVAKPDVDTRYGVLDEANRHLVFICRDGSLRIHDLTDSSSTPRSVTHAQGAAVWTGVFSDDGRLFFSGHQNGEVLVWDTANWELQLTISLGAEWPVRQLAAAPDGSAFVAESKQALELWSLSGDQPMKIADVGDRYNFGEGLAFSPQGDLIATGGMFDIVLYNAENGAKLSSMHHASYTMGLEFSPDGKRIASAPRGNINKFLGVFDVNEERQLFNEGPFPHYISGMAFTPDGKRIAATGCEKVLRLFDATSGEIALSLPRPECGTAPAFSRDGRLLGWSEPDGYYYIELQR